MGFLTWGDASASRPLQCGGVQYRRSMAVSAVTAALLVAILALSHERAPVWVAAALPQQKAVGTGERQPAATGRVQAMQDAANDFGAMDEPEPGTEGRQALRQTAAEPADVVAHSSDAGSDDSSSAASTDGGSNHSGSGEASSTAEDNEGASSTADGGAYVERGGAQPSASSAAGSVGGEQETSSNSGSTDSGDANAGAAKPAEDGGTAIEQASPSAAQHGSASSPDGSDVASSPAPVDTDAVMPDGGIAKPAAASAGQREAPAGSGTRAGARANSASAGGQAPSPELQRRPGARESRGPIQPELLAAVRAAADKDGAVMLAVTNRDGALFQLPQLLSSMRLVPQLDVSQHLVVATYSAPAQAACLRQHRHCVLDDFGTGGLGGDGGDGIDGFAGWGSRRFKGITWRKIQLVQDILLQGYAVLSVDLDIVLFKNPLDPAFNPLMNRELDIWMAVDNGKMLNCGFYFVRPTDPADAFMREWLGRFNHEAADDIWEQAEFNQILKGTHATLPELRWEKIDEEWFPDLCFYLEARAVLPDQRQFGELFASTSDKLGNWDKMYGFHAACCKGGGPALPECKRATASALMQWQIHNQPSEWP